MYLHNTVVIYIQVMEMKQRKTGNCNIYIIQVFVYYRSLTNNFAKTVSSPQVRKISVEEGEGICVAGGRRISKFACRRTPIFLIFYKTVTKAAV